MKLVIMSAFGVFTV